MMDFEPPVSSPPVPPPEGPVDLVAIRERALQNDPEAQYTIARLSEDGSCPLSFETFIFCQRAADSGHCEAARLLALWYCSQSFLAPTFHPNFDLCLSYLARSVRVTDFKISLKHIASLPGLRLTDHEFLIILDFIKKTDPVVFCESLATFAELIQRNTIISVSSKDSILQQFEFGVKSRCAAVGSAAYGLGILYFISFFGDDKQEKSFALFRAAAFAGFRRAELYLAVCCSHGIGSPPSDETAYLHLTQALVDHEKADGLRAANNFLKANDQRPFTLFQRIPTDPQSRFVCYKFVTTLGLSHPDKTADQLLSEAADGGFPPAIKTRRIARLTG
jgi:TPR repeat protein